MKTHLISRSERDTVCGNDGYLFTHNAAESTCATCTKVAAKRKGRKNFCANCAGLILVQIFKGTGVCSVDCSKQLEKDGS